MIYHFLLINTNFLIVFIIMGYSTLPTNIYINLAVVLLSVCRRSISAPQIELIEDETLMVPQDYNMAMREVLCQIL